MKILQIGSDRSILEVGTASNRRMALYGDRFGELHCIIFSLKRHGLKDIQITPHAHAYPTNSLSRLLYVWDAVRLAQRVGKCDVVSTQDPFESGFIGWIVSVFIGVPLHVQIHTDFLSPEFVKVSFVNRIRLLIAGFVLRRASRIRVVSNRIKKSVDVRYHLEAPVSVLPIFVDIEKFKSAKPDEALKERFKNFKKKFLVVSRLEPEKSVALAIQAFTEADIQDSCLIIVGTGSDELELKLFAGSSPAKDRIFFEGRKDPIHYYKISNLVLFPSRYDGYGMVIIEALASGVPVLSTDVGIAREAGAIVSTQENFSAQLMEICKVALPHGRVHGYPYKSVEEYVEAYCNDVEACTKADK